MKKSRYLIGSILLTVLVITVTGCSSAVVSETEKQETFAAEKPAEMAAETEKETEKPTEQTTERETDPATEETTAAPKKEAVVIECGGYRFPIPAEFDQEYPTQGFDLSYCPSEEEYYASLGFRTESLGGVSQKDFAAGYGGALSMILADMGQNTFADQPVYKMDVDDTKAHICECEDADAKYCFALLGNEDTDTLVLAVCVADAKDTSDNDYIGDFKEMLESAERIKGEKKEPETEPETEKQEASGIRPEFKEALDSYEAFFDEYVEILKAYEKNPGDLQLLVKYADYLAKYSEAMEKLEELEDEDMSLEESAYFLEVTARIEKKLLEVAQ